jgi:hypothetical protein
MVGASATLTRWSKEDAAPRRILGAVTEPHAVRRLLAALGLAAEPAPHRSAHPRPAGTIVRPCGGALNLGRVGETRSEETGGGEGTEKHASTTYRRDTAEPKPRRQLGSLAVLVAQTR